MEHQSVLIKELDTSLFWLRVGNTVLIKALLYTLTHKMVLLTENRLVLSIYCAQAISKFTNLRARTQNDSNKLNLLWEPVLSGHLQVGSEKFEIEITSLAHLFGNL